jgi:hypothetical protein
MVLHTVDERDTFKNEALLAQDGNYVRAAIRYHLIDTPERLNQRIAANFRLRFASATLTVDSIKQIAKAISVKMMSRTSSLAAPSRKVDMERAAVLVREIDATLNPDVVLDAQQLETVQKIISSQHGLHIISGGAGTGKSLLTKLLATQLAGRGVALTATTGNAACQLSCMAHTVHTTFSIHSAVYLDANFSNSPECMLFISKCSVFFIDEFSMLHNRNFDTVLARIMKAQGLTCMSDVLLHNLVVLVGDHAQLPPFCACSDSFKVDGVCPMHHIFSNSFFKQALKTDRYHNLSVNHRCGSFSRFLDNVRSASPETPLTQQQVNDALSDCLHPDYDPTPADYVITSHRALAAKYNHRLLHEDHGPNVTTVGLAIRQQLEHEQQHQIEFLELPGPAQEVPKRKSTGNLLDTASPSGVRRCPRFVFFLYIAVGLGAPVRITRNIDITRKMVRGAAGVVADLRFKHNVLTSIEVQLENGGKIVSFSRMTPVCVWAADRKLMFQEFPLMLKYASIVHSVQGCTLTKNIFIDIECFAPGLGYVALSSNTNRSRIRIKRMPSVEYH